MIWRGTSVGSKWWAQNDGFSLNQLEDQSGVCGIIFEKNSFESAQTVQTLPKGNLEKRDWQPVMKMWLS